MTLPLHIFEPRYREMVTLCVTERKPFGVVLIETGPEVGGPAQPHPVGTYGTVSRVEKLPDGRMNIEVIGQERFRIHELHHDQSYLTGTVEKFPLAAHDDGHALRCARQLTPWITQYLKLLGQVADISFDKQEMPANPVALAYFAAIIVQVPMAEKQALLNCSAAEDMLDHERTLYRREISLIRAMLSSPQSEHNADISPN